MNKILAASSSKIKGKDARRRKLQKDERRIKRRLSKARKLEDKGRPMLSDSRVKYEVGEKTKTISNGAIPAIHQIAVSSGLVLEIDKKVEVLKYHRPYHESDHVLNIAYNILCGGRVLEDIELRRQDEAYLDALGTESIPDPTTAGDFCRRFKEYHIEQLMDAINTIRLNIWRNQGQEFFEQVAKIDADGTLVPTYGECKEGMDISYKGDWGYHPLVVSLANTNEPLFIVNRRGNRPSHEEAPKYFDKAIELCRKGGYSDILLRGDTDFSLTKHFDRWNKNGIRFVFGYNSIKKLRKISDEIENEEYHAILKKTSDAFNEKKQREKPPRVKEGIVRERGYKNLKLKSESTADFEYKPGNCNNTYRMVVLKKNISHEKGEQVLFDDIRYFYYVTNDWKMSCEEVIQEARHRCDQENLIEQLKNGVRALHAPVNTLNANWAYMIMASLAWILKAWMALLMPIFPRWRKRHEMDRNQWLRMDFRTFSNHIINMPAQVLRTGRYLIIRLLGWRPAQMQLFRLLDGL